MPQNASFDVTTGVDLQEVDNAINQAQKEVAQRYDFKGTNATIEFKRAEEMIVLAASSDFQMNALLDIVESKLVKRHVPIKNLDIGEIKPAGGDTVRREHGSEFYAEIGRKGGEQTKNRQGSAFYARIGRIGGQRNRARLQPDNNKK